MFYHSYESTRIDTGIERKENGKCVSVIDYGCCAEGLLTPLGNSWEASLIETARILKVHGTMNYRQISWTFLGDD